MTDIKDDASTDIEDKVKAFAKGITAAIATLRKAREEALVKDGKDDAKVPVVTFSYSRGKGSVSRTPAEQAAYVVKGTSKVCWSSHMSDRARHVIMKVDGQLKWDAKKALGDDFAEFKKKWNALMTTHGLKNAAGRDGWPSWDQFHLELPASKISRTHEKAKACLDEYAKMTRKDGKKKNEAFEKKYEKLLKPHIEKYEKQAKTRAGHGATAP